MCENFKESVIQKIIQHTNETDKIPMRVLTKDKQMFIFALAKHDKTSPYLQYNVLRGTKITEKIDDRYMKTDNYHYIFDIVSDSKVSVIDEFWWYVTALIAEDDIFPYDIFGEYYYDIDIIYEDTFSPEVMKGLEEENAVSKKIMIKKCAFVYQSFFENKVGRSHLGV